MFRHLNIGSTGSLTTLASYLKIISGLHRQRERLRQRCQLRWKRKWRLELMGAEEAGICTAEFWKGESHGGKSSET